MLPRVFFDTHVSESNDQYRRGNLISLVYQKAKPGMSIQSWSEDVIVVNLSHRLEDHAELKTVAEMVREKGDCNVVIDFSDVAVVGSPTFARLLELQQVLQDSGHKLVLCGLSPAIKGAFSIVRLDSIFDFVEDRFAALACLQIVG